MADDALIDLTSQKPPEGFKGFSPTDIILIVVGGGVGFLAKEAFKFFFPGRPTVEEQLKVLAELIEAAGKAKAKSLKVRISTDANTQLQLEMPKAIGKAKVLRQNANTIDLEISFAHQPRRGRSRRGRTGKPMSGSHSPHSKRPRTVADPSLTPT
jgi:hypothetical protein